MTNAIDIKQKQRFEVVASNLDSLAKSRESIIQNPKVNERLTETEVEIAIAGTRTPIAAINQDKLRAELGLFCKGICRDLGIRTWDNPDIMQADTARFYTFLIRYYKHMTIKEIMQAFEFLMAGRLDKYLPKNSAGDPDRGHYQMFSLEFQTKVINAYEKLKNQTWSKIYSIVPDQKIITEEEKVIYHRSFIDMIRQKFNAYFENGYMPPIYGASIIMAEFERQQIVTGFPTPKDHNFDRALLKIISSNIPDRTKYEVKESREAGIEHELLKAEAQTDAISEAVKKVFDKIIESKLDISNVIKYRL